MAALQQAVGSGPQQVVSIRLAATAAPAADPYGEPSSTAAPAPESAVSGEALRMLQGENPDFVGWLRLPGTQVDYPVVQSPDRPQYYLRRDFSKKRSTGGTPFIDERCDLGGNRGNLIVYGHNMKNGSLFGELKKLLDPAFYEAHRTITFDTPEGPGTYRVAAVSLVRVDPAAAFQFYWYPNLTTEADFDRYTAGIVSDSAHPQDMDLFFGDELLTLATCSKHVEDGRLLVVGKRIQ